MVPFESSKSDTTGLVPVGHCHGLMAGMRGGNDIKIWRGKLGLITCLTVDCAPPSSLKKTRPSEHRFDSSMERSGCSIYHRFTHNDGQVVRLACISGMLFLPFIMMGGGGIVRGRYST